MIELLRGLSFVMFTYEGGPTRFHVPFPYIEREHVKAFVGEPGSARNVAASWIDASTLEIPSQDGLIDAPYTVTLRRMTPIDDLLVVYKDGANLPARDLSKSFRQLLYAHQELLEHGSEGGLPGGPPGGGGGHPDLNEIIDQLLRSPALQDLLTRIDLIDMNAEAIMEEILRSHEFFDVARDYGDKISQARHEVALLTEGNAVIAQELVDLFARVDAAEQSQQAQYLELNQAIADERSARVSSYEGLQAQIVQGDQAVSAAINERIDTVEADSEAARAALEQRLGAEFGDSLAQVRQEIETEVDATKARVSDVETAVAQHGDNIGALMTTTDALSDATGANTSFRQAMAAKYGSNVPEGIANEIDGEISAVSAAFDQKIATEASAREALAEQVTTLESTTAPTYFGANPPAAPQGGHKVPTFWVKTGQTGSYLTHVWNGSEWLKADIDITSPTGALVQQLQSTKIDSSQAQAIAQTQVQAFQNGAFAALQQSFNVVAGEHAGMYGQWQASYSVKINGGKLNGQPVIAGISLSANPQTGSDFIVQADRFAVVHPSYTSGGSLATLRFPFVVGTVGGVSTVGVQGQLIVDGSITADKITTNTLSAITANAGTINGGTFKTHTLNAQGQVTNPSEFRVEISNAGTWPFWIGSGTKNANNAVVWIDRNGNAMFKGKVNAPNIVGQFQSAVTINVTTPHDAPYEDDWYTLHSFTLPRPVLAGETHMPFVSVRVSHNLTRSVAYLLEYLDSSVWRELDRQNYYEDFVYLRESDNAVLMGTAPPTGTAQQFRIRIRFDRPAGADWLRVYRIAGAAFGIR